jgi:hypothetical protein
MSAMPTEVFWFDSLPKKFLRHEAAVQLSSTLRHHDSEVAFIHRTVPRGTADPLTNGVAFFVS